MKKNTFKDYKEAVQLFYETAKNNDASGILFNPSPAQMRTLCLLICDRILSKKEEEVFRLFFETKENELLKKSIEHCNIDKFRPIISFLRRESDTENAIRVEMAAIIIDFKLRPYSLFSKTDDEIAKEVQNYTIQEESTVVTDSVKSKNIAPTNTSSGDSYRNKIIVGSLVVLSALGVKKTLFKDKECMKWCGDHYELVDCIDKKQGVVSYEIIKPYDEREFERKELNVCDTTEFFVNENRDNPKVWYDKEKDGIHFFNMGGVSPETGDHLNPITDYMIEKYVASCE